MLKYKELFHKEMTIIKLNFASTSFKAKRNLTSPHSVNTCTLTERKREKERER